MNKPAKGTQTGSHVLRQPASCNTHHPESPWLAARKLYFLLIGQHLQMTGAAAALLRPALHVLSFSDIGQKYNPSSGDAHFRDGGQDQEATTTFEASAHI